MEEKEFEHEDPFTLTGMVFDLPEASAREAQVNMAVCFIEEYAMLGYSDEKIVELFENPFYRATHDVWRKRGESFIRGLIRQVRTGEPAGVESAKEKNNG